MTGKNSEKPSDVISVIIPTRNRAKFLSTALDSIAGQSLEKNRFEVLVIDNGSTDSTPDVVTSASAFLPNLRYFFEPEVGLHAGRHRGLRESNGAVLVYVDDDIRATPTWLEAVAENFADPGIWMLGGNNLPDFQGNVPAWLRDLWEAPVNGGRSIGQLSVLELPEGRRPIDPHLIWGCNFSCRKQLIVDAGGFHPDGMPQDRIQFRGDGETWISRYAREHGLGCVFDSRATVYHAVTAQRMTFHYFRQRAFNQGVSDSYTRLRNAPGPGRAALYTRLLARRLTHRAQDLILAVAAKKNEVHHLRKLVRDSHHAGFMYHQRMYRKDPEVRAWVHKRDYF